MEDELKNKKELEENEEGEQISSKDSELEVVKEIVTEMNEELASLVSGGGELEIRKMDTEQNGKRAADAARLPAHLEHPDTFTNELPALQYQKNFLLLVEGVKFHIWRPAVVTAGLGAVLALLWGAANNSENAGTAFHAGVLLVTLEAMEKHSNELSVIQVACYVLWSINANSPEEELIRTETGARGGMPLLFAALDAFGTVSKVTNAVAVALVNVMANNPTNQVLFIDFGGVERMLNLVKHYDIMIQKKAIGALLNLVEHDRVVFRKMAQDRLIALDVQTPVRSAMEKPASTKNTKEWGQRLLDKLAEVASTAARDRTGTPELWEREISKQSSVTSSSSESSEEEEQAASSPHREGVEGVNRVQND